MIDATAATLRRGVRSLRRGVAALLLGLAAAACRGDGVDGEPPAADAMLPMPTLEERPLPEAHAAGSVLSAVVAGPSGEVLALPVDADGVFVVLTDDAPPRFYGAPGEGPGELRIAQPLIVDDTAVVGYDLGTRRIIVFDRASGAVRRELRPRDRVVPYYRGSAGTLVATRLDRGITLPALIDLATGRVREGVPPSDTAGIALFAGEADLPGHASNIAVIGRWHGGTLLANGMHYRIVLYDDEGRVVGRIDRGFAPRTLSRHEVEREISRLGGTPMGRSSARLDAIRQRIEREPRQWFTHLSAPRDDGQGRLWVVVEHGDSTVADVYADEQLLGSLRLDCPGYEGRWDLAGEWLVMLCAPSDPESLEDVEIRRWRIVEPGDEMAGSRGDR